MTSVGLAQEPDASVSPLPPALGKPVPESREDLQAIEDHVVALAKKVIPAVVGVDTASGVIVSEDGYVLTAAHVAGGPDRSVKIIFPDGRTVRGVTLGVNRSVDGGLIKIVDEGPWPFVEMGRSKDLEPGDWCMGIGHPAGFQPGRTPPVRLGRILENDRPYFRSDCTGIGGDSGGPLFDMYGRVIGTRSHLGRENLFQNYYTAVDTFHDNWDRLVAGEAWGSTDRRGQQPRQHQARAERVGPGPNGVLVRGSVEFRHGFVEPAAKVQDSIVRVRCEGKDTALGVVVREDGFVLTKASDLEGVITIELPDGVVRDATLVGVHEPHDLAVLRVDAESLVPVEWTDSSVAAVGAWVISPDGNELPAAVGVLSVAARKMPPNMVPWDLLRHLRPPPTDPFLGVGLEDGPETGAFIGDVLRGCAADRAGLRRGDIIVGVSGNAISDSDALLRTLASFKAGEPVTLKIRRGDGTLETKATLDLNVRPSSRRSHNDPQNYFGSRLSNRRNAFTWILQHDSEILPEDCGGPLVDFQGRVIGLNVSRWGRTETWTIPAEAIKPLLDDLIAGKQRRWG